MEKRKHILSMLLLIATCLFSNNAFAEAVEIDGIYYNLVTKIKEAEVTSNPNKYTGTVNIPETVTYNNVTYSVTSIGEYAFIDCSGLTSVTIPNSVTSIGEGAFSGCTGLTSVNIPNSVTSIGNAAFRFCFGLKKVIVPDIAAWCGIKFGDYYANPLYYAHHLYSDETTEITNLIIPNSVTSIGGYAFFDCSGLTSVTIPNSVTSIGGAAFYDCSGLTSVTIPNSVTSIGYQAFYYCSGLTSVTIPNSVTSIEGAAFYNCDGLEKVIVPDIAAWCGIKFAGYSANPLFYAKHLYSNETTEITNLIIPNSVKSIGSNAFSGCSSLTSVTIPNSVTSIGEGAFYGCSGLTSVNIGNGVKSIGSDAFADCAELTDVYCYAESVPTTQSDAFDGSYTEYATLHVPATSIEQYKNTIPWNKFGTLLPLDESVPDRIQIDGIYYNLVTKAKQAEVTQNPNEYRGAVNIPETITYNDVTYSVTSIGYRAFSGCPGLASVTIPNSVTSIGNVAFDNCYGLKKVIVPDIAAWCGISFENYNSNPLIYAGHLYSDETTEITNLIIPNSVTSIGSWAFINCSGLTSVTIPNSVTSIGDFAFNDCSGLTSVNIGNSVTSIGICAFYGCSGLTSVTIPNSVISIGEEAFSSCSGLTSVTIPNSVTSIGGAAFYGCSSLTSVNIGKSVKSIGSSAFAKCTELTDVYCYAEKVPTTQSSAFADSHIEYVTLHVPAASVEQYKKTAPWSNFGTIVATDGTIPEPPTREKCATPTISYSKGKLTFKSETEDAICLSTITNKDITSYSSNEVQLQVTYNISVYATKANYENSDTIQATLCWIEQQPQTEGITDEDAIAEVQAVPVLIQTQGNTIAVEGAEAGTEIILYGVNGVQLDSVIATTGTASLNASRLSGSVAIVKIGNKTVKVLVKQ